MHGDFCPIDLIMMAMMAVSALAPLRYLRVRLAKRAGARRG